MITASFTSIYLPTLATVSTIVALGTVYLARSDRREERASAFLNKWVAGYERVESAVLDLVEVADQARLGQQMGRFEVARRRLRSAVAATFVSSFVQAAERLAHEPPESVGGKADEALVEAARAIQRAEAATSWGQRKRFSSRRVRNAHTHGRDSGFLSGRSGMPTGAKRDGFGNSNGSRSTGANGARACSTTSRETRLLPETTE